MKFRYKYLTILLLATAMLNSCKVYQVSDIAGVYENKWHDTQHKIELNKDCTFVFYVKEGLLIDTIDGKWNLDKKRLLLEEQKEKPYYKMIECDTCSLNYLCVYDAESGEKIPAYLKSYNEGNLLEEKNMYLDAYLQENADSIFIESLGYNPFGVKLKGNTSKHKVFLSKKTGDFLKNKFKIKQGEIKSSNGLVLEKVTN